MSPRVVAGACLFQSPLGSDAIDRACGRFFIMRGGSCFLIFPGARAIRTNVARAGTRGARTILVRSDWGAHTPCVRRDWGARTIRVRSENTPCVMDHVEGAGMLVTGEAGQPPATANCSAWVSVISLQFLPGLAPWIAGRVSACLMHAGRRAPPGWEGARNAHAWEVLLYATCV